MAERLCRLLFWTRVHSMSTQAMLADALLREAGHEGLWEWAMNERRSVRPPNWDEVASRLRDATRGKVSVRGEMLRKWLLAAELERAEELTR